MMPERAGPLRERQRRRSRASLANWPNPARRQSPSVLRRSCKNCHWPIWRISVKSRDQAADMDRRRPVTSSSSPLVLISRSIGQRLYSSAVHFLSRGVESGSWRCSGRVVW